MRILFAHLGFATFVQRDFDILSHAHDVRAVHYVGIRSLPALFAGVRWSELTFCWFGTIHALFTIAFSRMLGKKSVVVSGGYEVAKTPLVPRYGPLSKWHKRYGVLFVFANADLVLCVSKFNRQETIANARVDPGRTRLLYHGFDGHVFQRPRSTAKEKLAVTVAHIDRLSLRLKGLDVFARSASHLDNVPFVVVGPHNNKAALARLRALAASNVRIVGPLYADDLVAQLSSAQVYVQPSIRESFGCAVAEAMLCECVPVVSKQAALPEVVGDCGFYVDLEPEAVAQGVRQALGSDLGAKARARVMDLFPLERRRRGLLQAIDDVVSQ